jgi:hypothetical protein
MLPRRIPHRPRLESGIELREPEPRAVDAESEEALPPEEEERRRAYAEWLSRFDSRKTAA